MNNRKAIRVLAVALVIFAVFMVYNLVRLREDSRRVTCLRQLMAMEGAKEQFAIEHGGEPPPELTTLVPRYMKQLPVCPSGGSYIIGNMQTNVMCSVAAHAWEWK